MSGRPVIHRAEIGARQDDLDLALANGDDQPVLKTVVQDSASRFLAARAEPAAPGRTKPGQHKPNSGRLR